MKKLNDDLETCRIALKTVVRDYGPALDPDPAEINGLIDDKRKSRRRRQLIDGAAENGDVTEELQGDQ